jgi:hypothetical protein
MLEIKRRQQLDPNYEFDTPVPDTNKNMRNKNVALTGSLGDLAPSSLR